MPFFRVLATTKNLLSSACAVRRKKEHDCYLKNGSAVLEEFLALCDGNCRIPIRYFSAVEINNATKHSKTIILDVYVVTGLLEEDNVLDPIILEEHGTEIQRQLEDYLDLVKKCTADDRPYMIHVARELCRMEMSFRSCSK